MSSGLVEITAVYRHQTEKAIAVWDGKSWGSETYEIWTWLPKKLIEYERTGDGEVVVKLPEWLVVRHDLEDCLSELRAEADKMANQLERIEARITRLEEKLGLNKPIQ